MSLASFSSLLDFAIKQQNDALTFFTTSTNDPSATHREGLAHAPESHACKGVDEWLSGPGFAPRTNPEPQEATAVRPWSFTKLCNDAEKNIKTLKTILRENVSEIVMEPLEELNEADYLLQIEGVDTLQDSINILERQRDFFEDAARVINLKDVKRLFEKMSTKVNSSILEIKN